MKNITILSSSKINDLEILENPKNNIDKFLKEHISDDDIVTIGKMKNSELIKYFQSQKYKLEIKTQPPKIIKQQNKSMIKQSDITLFLNYNKSSNIQKYIEYTKTLKDKVYYILNIQCDSEK